MPFQIMSWVFGFGAMLSLFLIYQQKERKKLLYCKLSADLCWVAHYLCLWAPGGAIPNFVGIFRELVFVNREDKKWANSPLWPILFILINLSLGIATMDEPINLLPITASVFVTLSLWLKKPVLTKIISIPVSVCFLIYDIFVGSYIGIVNESIAICSIIISFIKENKTRKDKKHAEKI